MGMGVGNTNLCFSNPPSLPPSTHTRAHTANSLVACLSPFLGGGSIFSSYAHATERENGMGNGSKQSLSYHSHRFVESIKRERVKKRGISEQKNKNE